MKVCFFSPTAYACFNPRAATWAGGAEMQQLLLARHMVASGIDVSFIVGDYGQPEIETFEGITVIRSFAPFTGNRKLRFPADMLKIRRAMRLAGADVFNQRSTSFFTGQLAYFARRLGKAFTFSAGTEYNAYPDCQGLLRWPMTALYRYGIASADAVIAQTERQRRLMAANFHREVVVIRNGIAIHDLAPESGAAPGGPARAGAAPEFLWVGSLVRVKRPELFLEMARRLPEARFTLVGKRGDDDPEYRDLPDRARAIPNFTYEGFVPPGEITRYYARAYALVNTSRFEGFPNTYLHSWLHGTPVLTIDIDPDGIIEEHAIGTVAGSVERLVEAARSLISNPAARGEMSVRAAAYVRANHDIRDRGNDYIRLFEAILAARSAPARRLA